MATKPTKHEQTIISRHFFQTDYFPFEKKQVLSDSNPGPLRPRRIRCLQAQCAESAQKLKFIIN